MKKRLKYFFPKKENKYENNCGIKVPFISSILFWSWMSKGRRAESGQDGRQMAGWQKVGKVAGRQSHRREFYDLLSHWISHEKKWRKDGYILMNNNTTCLISIITSLGLTMFIKQCLFLHIKTVLNLLDPKSVTLKTAKVPQWKSWLGSKRRS